jgi:hypothetical protein
MPVAPFCDIVCARLLADFAIATGAIPVTGCFAVTGRREGRLTTLGLRGFFADLMASLMALAPVRSANRAMALSERWNDRLKIATYRCPAYDAHQNVG